MHAMFTEAVLTQRRVQLECFVAQMTVAVKEKLMYLEDDFYRFAFFYTSGLQSVLSQTRSGASPRDFVRVNPAIRRERKVYHKTTVNR